ncbi:hemolysin [Fulvitalea axinellae]|uniref:Hemolysin n=1 Tax=Fulvitalea axinellae TaxID=1182444 RepID=A0AAU9CGD2_9BACT|nr:hemolysin [Fulvitalea axinellae]
MEDSHSLIIIFVCLLLSALFSGVEIAFVSSDRLSIELERKKGKFSANIIAKFYEKSSRFIGTTLIGNTLSLVVYTIYMTELMESLNAQYDIIPFTNELAIFLIQTIITTVIVLFTAEYTPKSLFLVNPNRALTAAAPFILLMYYLLYPFVWMVMGLSKFVITKVMRLEYSDTKPAFGRTELNNYIRERVNDTSAEENEVDTRIFSNALEFKKTKVRECLIPRTEVVAVDINDDIETLSKAFVDSGHSKVLVYKDTIDEVLGFCHSNSMFSQPDSIKDILNPIPLVTETMLANDVMLKFITERKSIALVVDEYGGTSGIISIEDVMEEIFGEIQDEHDNEYREERKINDNTFLFSARHEIDDLNERYTWTLPCGDYDTLGGLILSETGSIPELNDIIRISPFTFTIMSMEENRIDLVKMEINKGENLND